MGTCRNTAYVVGMAGRREYDVRQNAQHKRAPMYQLEVPQMLRRLSSATEGRAVTIIEMGRSDKGSRTVEIDSLYLRLGLESSDK